MKKNNVVENKSFAFSVRIVCPYQYLRIRSETSAGVMEIIKLITSVLRYSKQKISNSKKTLIINHQ